MPFEHVQGDWFLLEILERVIEKGVAFDVFVVGDTRIEMGRVWLVLPPNEADGDDDDDGGDDDGAAAQLRLLRHEKLEVVSSARRLARP